MGNKNERILIFHIYRSDGTPLFLHPFDDRNTLFSLAEGVETEGKFGREPRVESLTMFRNKLYRLIEKGVKEWIADTKFIPRFILSAVVFLIVYFFTSLVIRDPIPVLDELLISIGASAAAYYILSRRDQNSEKASGKRLQLRMHVDRIVFNESSFIIKFEELLHYNEKEEAVVLLSNLEKMFSGREYKKQEKRLSKNRKEDKNHFLSWAKTNKVDLSLYAAYRNIKLISLPD